MDEVMMLYVAAGIMTTVAGVLLYRDAKKQRELFDEAEAEEAIVIEKPKAEAKKPKKKKQ